MIVSSIASFLLWWEHFFSLFAYYVQWKTQLDGKKKWEIKKLGDNERKEESSKCRINRSKESWYFCSND